MNQRLTVSEHLDSSVFYDNQINWLRLSVARGGWTRSCAQSIKL